MDKQYQEALNEAVRIVLETATMPLNPIAVLKDMRTQGTIEIWSYQQNYDITAHTSPEEVT